MGELRAIRQVIEHLDKEGTTEMPSEALERPLPLCLDLLLSLGSWES